MVTKANGKGLMSGSSQRRREWRTKATQRQPFLPPLRNPGIGGIEVIPGRKAAYHTASEPLRAR